MDVSKSLKSSKVCSSENHLKVHLFFSLEVLWLMHIEIISQHDANNLHQSPTSVTVYNKWT